MSKVDRLRNYIGGEWIDSISGDVIDKIDPTYGQKIATLPDSDSRDALAAIEHASTFRDNGGWRKIETPKLEGIFDKIMGTILDRREDLIEKLVLETGKHRKEAMGEIKKTVETFKVIRNNIYNTAGETLSSKSSNAILYTKRDPVGVIVSITPWNFPFYIGAQHLAPAIAGRNAVIYKCSPEAPISSTMLFKILLESGVPSDMISLVHGYGENLQELVLDERVDMVSFTGKSSTAQAIGEKRKGFRFVYEGGGNNFQVVLADSDIKMAAEKAIQGATMLSGQKCVATGGALVEEKILDEFIKQAKKMMQKIRVGDVNKDADIGPLIGKGKADEISEELKKAENEGGVIKIGGNIISPTGTKGEFFEPTIIVVPRTASIVEKELFSPILKIISVRDLDDALQIINKQGYGLSASICTKNAKDAYKFVSNVRVGIVNVNSHTGGTEAHMPFGGRGLSGNGYRLGNAEEALRAFTEIKAIKWDMG